jgi:tryptophanyl-tRNA synthetase
MHALAYPKYISGQENIGSFTLQVLQDNLACGVDPEKVTFFNESQVPEIFEIFTILSMFVSYPRIMRVPTIKDEIREKNLGDAYSMGYLNFPILMAADIISVNADLVPVGEDQRQHIELTRDLAGRFNARYGQTFQLPEAYILKAGAKINDIQDPTSKMSKSSGSVAGVIEIMDTPDANLKKIKSAITDAGREVRFDQVEKPGISNLLTIHSALSGTSIADLEKEFDGKGYGDFKTSVAEVVVEYLRPIRQRALDLLSDEKHLIDILHSGSAKAREVAEQTLSATYKGLGVVS